MGKGFVSAKAINEYTWKCFQYLEEKLTMFTRAGQGIKGVTLAFVGIGVSSILEFLT